MDRGMSMTERAEHVANNVWLMLVGRVAMAVTGALFVPAMIGIWAWASSTGADLSDLRGRVVMLETNATRAVQSNDKFQNDTTDTLREVLRLVSASNERQARLEAQIEALQRQIDNQVR